MSKYSKEKTQHAVKLMSAPEKVVGAPGSCANLLGSDSI